VSDRVSQHVKLFNEPVQRGDWSTFVASFAPAAVMRFVSVPAGPYEGRDAIAAAYAVRPPTSTMTIKSIARDGDIDVVRFVWDAGSGGGTLRVRWRDDLVEDLTINLST
jgi:steroid Delta-isomerase